MQNSHSRISTEEIDATIHLLQAAFVDGRLTESECEERMALVVQAKTQEEIFALSCDLSTSISSEPDLPQLGQSTLVLMSGFEQRGPFLMPKNYSIKAIMGGCLLDLRHAKLQSDVTNIKVVAIMGGVQILVPKGVRVSVRGVPILGGFSNNVSPDAFFAPGPRINIYGKAIMGGVEVK